MADRQGSPTTSAIVRPDGALLAYRWYEGRGLLVADLGISEATGLLAAALAALLRVDRATQAGMSSG